jgi:hypothetical protein
MAGLFDGEGWIRAQVVLRKDSKGCSLVLQIGIANTDKPVLDWVESRFGGHVKSRRFEVNQHPYPRAKPWLWKPRYEWGITDKQGIKVVITAIFPYLQIKRSRADLLLRLLNQIRGSGAGTEMRGGIRRRASYPVSYWENLKVLADGISIQNSKHGPVTYKIGRLHVETPNSQQKKTLDN